MQVAKTVIQEGMMVAVLGDSCCPACAFKSKPEAGVQCGAFTNQMRPIAPTQFVNHEPTAFEGFGEVRRAHLRTEEQRKGNNLQAAVLRRELALYMMRDVCAEHELGKAD